MATNWISKWIHSKVIAVPSFIMYKHSIDEITKKPNLLPNINKTSTLQVKVVGLWAFPQI